jgi:23S rRNA (uracil1939-C5)-methyltransferase
LIALPYPEQLLRKRDFCARALAIYPCLASLLDMPAVVPSPLRLGYRARVKLVVRGSRGKVATGLYVPGTHRVIDISSCPIHPRPVNQVARYLKEKVVEMDIAPYDERDDSGQLRYIDFRYSFARRALVLTLVTRHGKFPQGIALARAFSRRFSFVSGVIQNINEQRGNVILGDDNRILLGRDTLVEKVGPLELAFAANVFSQANPSTAKHLYQSVVEMADLRDKQCVLDLYCGVGPISLLMAVTAHLVCGIDENSACIDLAKQNARRNGISNCRFISGDVAQTVAEAKNTFGPIDTVVLNPPRKGVQPSAMAAILAVAAAKIIYVSCEPRTLARDLNELVNRGYRVLRLQPFDMFPHTDQVECVALLEKA